MAAGPAARLKSLVKSGALAADPAQARAAERLQRLHNELRTYAPGARSFLGLGARRPAPRGVYLFGGVGRGKSMLMDLFFGETPFAAKRRVHFHAFMRDVHAMVKAWREKDPGDPLPNVARDLAQDAGLLCFDEFQVSDVADAMILGRLFESLFAQGVVVVATSNRAPDALYEGGLNRQLFLPFIALLKQKLDVLELYGPTDYRLEKMQGVTTYVHPLGPKADAAMDAAFLRLTGVRRGQPAELPVQGRILRVPQAAKGVARAGFSDLCAAALGPADYLMLGETFHTLVLDRIPKMGPEKRNEARRFVTLIDTLYEAKTKLVCSAEGPPDALYPAGDGSFEFQRTASRLVEMQSADYLALGHMG